jgi:hypothetical protein
MPLGNAHFGDFARHIASQALERTVIVFQTLTFLDVPHRLIYSFNHL